MYSITDDGVAGMEQSLRTERPSRPRAADEVEIDPDDEVRAHTDQMHEFAFLGLVRSTVRKIAR